MSSEPRSPTIIAAWIAFAGAILAAIIGVAFHNGIFDRATPGPVPSPSNQTTEVVKPAPERVAPTPSPIPSPERSPTPKEPELNLEVIAIGRTKSGTIVEKQVIEYRFEATRNIPVFFAARLERVEPVQAAYGIEICDSEGSVKDSTYLSTGITARTFAFTPTESGSYILRIKGTKKFGKYFVSMKDRVE